MKKIFISILMVLLAVPAFAIELVNTGDTKVNLYGTFRLLATYGHVEQAGKTTASDLFYNMQGNSRIGVNFSVGQFFGTAELNFTGDGQTPGVGFRQLFAGWTFENGSKLLAGNKATPASSISSTYQDIFFVDNGLAGFGTLTQTRRPLIQYSIAGVDIALVSNAREEGKSANPNVGTQVVGYHYANTYIPRIELAYNMKYDNFTGKIGAAYALFTQKNVGGTAEYNQYVGRYANINAFHVTAQFKPVFGPFYFNVSAFYGMNAEMYGAAKQYTGGGINAGLTSKAPLIDPDGNVNNVQQVGVALELGYKIVNSFSLILGGGWQMNMADNYRDLNGAKKDLQAYAVYLQAPWKFNKYMALIPQVGYYSEDALTTTANPNGDANWTILAGAQLRISF